MSLTPKDQPTQQELQIQLLYDAANQALDLLATIAGRSPNEDLRKAAIHKLALAGSKTALNLVKLADDLVHGEEVRQIAEHSEHWPIWHSAWPIDRDHATKSIPPKLIGSKKEIQAGHWDPKNTANFWAKRFVETMQLARLAKQRFNDTAQAHAYLIENHTIDLPFADIEQGAALPVFTRETSSQWKEALKIYLRRHFPNYGLAQHPDWQAERHQTSKDGDGTLGGDPKEFSAWIIGRIGSALMQRAN